eukprot:scaffold16494_cov17-Tisochrysis_lutea.AAC.1
MLATNVSIREATFKTPNCSADTDAVQHIQPWKTVECNTHAPAGAQTTPLHPRAAGVALHLQWHPLSADDYPARKAIISRPSSHTHRTSTAPRQAEEQLKPNLLSNT